MSKQGICCFERLRRAKGAERGGFDDCLFLI
jgi:hypothetical protein